MYNSFLSSNIIFKIFNLKYQYLNYNRFDEFTIII